MTRDAIPLTLILALSAGAVPGTAQAQSFLERLAERAADRAATAIERGVMGSGENGGSSRDREEAEAPTVMRPRGSGSAARDERSAVPPAPAGRSPARSSSARSAAAPAPWPVNLEGGVRRPGHLEFGPGDIAAKEAFDQFGRVACTGCEGGRSYDSWGQQQFRFRDPTEWERRLGELPMGQTISWQGVESRGEISVVSETPVGEFQCRQLKWRLTKGSETAERPGLVCMGLASDFSATERWVEVF